MSLPILTDADGRPFEKPIRSDFDSDIKFIEAFHAYRQSISDEANRSFDESFTAALRKRTPR